MATPGREPGPKENELLVGVEYVEKNKTMEITAAPNDPRFDSQYAPQQVNADRTVGRVLRPDRPVLT